MRDKSLANGEYKIINWENVETGQKSVEIINITGGQHYSDKEEVLFANELDGTDEARNIVIIDSMEIEINNVSDEE